MLWPDWAHLAHGCDNSGSTGGSPAVIRPEELLILIDEMPDVSKMDKHEFSEWNAARHRLLAFHRGVIASVRVDDLNTYLEIRQQGDGLSPSGTLVSFTRVPRTTSDDVPIQVIADYLLLCLQRAANEGWQVLRS